MTTEKDTRKGRRLKIGIISLYGWLKLWDNYGTLLQNFALQKFLQQRGHTTFWIRTRSFTPATQGFSIKVYTKSLFHLRAFLRWLAIPLLGRSRSKILKEFNERNPRHFSAFMNRHTPISSREFTLKELVDDPPEVDALIVGSDQIWRDASRINFLDFGPQHIRRVAYAVSAPWPALDEAWFQNAIKYTPQFNAIGVRETGGIEVCKKLSRNDAVHVVDPVLLLEESHYLNIVRQDKEDHNFPKPFVLGYFVNINMINQIPWTPTVNFAHKKGSDLIVVPMQGAELVIPEKYLFTPSPSAWINAFHKASCVVTNSYHGALFAIVMRKPFLVFLQDGASSHENGRFISALKPLGLEDRMLSVADWREATVSTLESHMSHPIDWDDVSLRLTRWKKFSAEFLDMALKP